MRGKIVLRAGGMILAACCLVAVAAADVKLPGVFGDHMVLQRERPVPVWGWADAGEQVTVTLGDQSQTATADSTGKWCVKFDPLKTGGALELKVQGKANSVQFTDVLVGEVWLCSGQSNMAMSVGGVINRDAEIASADYPQIRLYTVDRKPAAEPKDNCGGLWRLCSPKTVGGFSAAGYFFGRELHKKLDVPVGLIDSSWGGTPIQTWMSVKAQEAVAELKPSVEGLQRQIEDFDAGKAKEQYEKQLTGWEKAAAKAKAAGKPFQDRKPQPPQDPRTRAGSPGTLYNGMIAPLAPYALRGAIWYQGEANAGSKIYGLQLKTMVANWRADWKSDLAFIAVQLPNFMAPQQKPSEGVGSWPLIREQFFKMLSAVPNTGMAVTIDVGEANNIHPRNKQEVGRRLAQWALAKTYGKPVVACGPLYKSMRVDGEKIVIEFDYADAGLAVRDGGKLKGFAIAGADKKFVWADAEVVGNTVAVSSAEVKSPVAVRYAWANNPDCNLVNKADLPASPFRTDDWAQ